MEIILTITHLLAEGKITVGKLWIVIEIIQVLSSTFPADDRKWSAENIYRTFSSLNILSLFLFLFLEMNHVKKKKVIRDCLIFIPIPNFVEKFAPMIE